ncbi:hypothetical protein [Arthrobacter sp. JSM 101049]|uniref:hypothetical protein n=1 Tax=Arthrobacter sp. JSM 101049 TaxID=929097 RepID=UPI003563DF26
MSSIATAALTTAGLIGGFQTARSTGNRPLGGVVLAAACAAAFASCQHDAGAGRASAVALTYLVGFGASHPLAKKIGAWPAVGAVAGATALTALVLGRRR